MYRTDKGPALVLHGVAIGFRTCVANQCIDTNIMTLYVLYLCYVLCRDRFDTCVTNQCIGTNIMSRCHPLVSRKRAAGRIARKRCSVLR